MSKLHDSLKNADDISLPSGKKINLYEHISKIKKSAKKWLSGLDKNGYNHSERLEIYLDSLTNNLRKTKKITSGEIFILLYATYIHDIGYNLKGKNVGKGHANRSQGMILANPSKYHFGDFPPFKGGYPRIAEAVGLVCLGHKFKIPNDNLDKIPDEFPDYIFSNDDLNLRKITALLRLADEADDPYIRFNLSEQSIRNRIPLVQIKGNTIIWHWDRTRENDPSIFSKYIEEKIEILESSINYLRSMGAGTWYIVLHPQIRPTQVKRVNQKKSMARSSPSDLKYENVTKKFEIKTSGLTGLPNLIDIPKIVIVGCGGAGNQIISRISKMNLSNVDTIAINTNKKILDTISANKRVLIGRSLTKGLGAHSDPSIGKNATEMAKPTLEALLESADIVFVTAGMGGGTGTGSAPVVARIAKEQGALVVAIVTYPFLIVRAGLKRADKGIMDLLSISDTTILVDNNDYRNISPNLTLDEIFSLIDRLIAETICGICESILEPSLIKIGVTDLRMILREGGLAAVSMGETDDKNKVRNVVRQCFDNMFNIDFNSVTGAFIQISGGSDMTMREIEYIAAAFNEKLDPKAEVSYGARVCSNMQDRLRVIVLITGLLLPNKFRTSKKTRNS